LKSLEERGRSLPASKTTIENNSEKVAVRKKDEQTNIRMKVFKKINQNIQIHFENSIHHYSVILTCVP
jgi:hypothetical protein